MPLAKTKSANRASRDFGAQFLYAAASACPHGLMVEQAGRVVYANRAFARFMGCRKPKDVIGRRLADLSPVEKRSAAGARESAPQPPLFETVSLPFRHGSQSAALTVVRDVSESRRMEQRLRESEKMEALGRLVGGVAHDFNNLLTAITLYSDLLLEQVPAQRRREVEEIHLAAQRGTAMVRQLLAFARRHPVAPRTVSLGHVISSMRGMLAPLLGENIRLVTSFTPESDTVRVDPAQLQQVVLNLVMNSRDAMPRGGRVALGVTANKLTLPQARRCGLRPGRYVSLSVADSGCGMDEQVRARVFEPFFTTKKNGSGTGLGMAMVFGIITQSGGHVTVSSKPGKGTRVTVLLPHVRAGVVREPLHTVPAPAPVAADETVLVLEDDDAVRASIAQSLLETGYHVIQGRDGEQGIRLARAHRGPIHLLIADLVMPGMSGSEAAEQVCRIHPESRLLLISGYHSRQPSPDGNASLLYKPFSRAVFVQKVREVLDRQPAVAAAAAP